MLEILFIENQSEVFFQRFREATKNFGKNMQSSNTLFQVELQEVFRKIINMEYIVGNRLDNILEGVENAESLTVESICSAESMIAGMNRFRERTELLESSMLKIDEKLDLLLQKAEETVDKINAKEEQMRSQPPYDKDTNLFVKELIVVEGKNDAQAIRQALGKVDIVWTEGFGLTEKKLNLISEMAERRGVIVCTDPDFVGRQIRDRISVRVPKARHVFISRRAALNKKGNDIGIENASSENIRTAFKKVLKEDSPSETFEKQYCSDNIVEMRDLLDNGLVGQEKSVAKRHALGKILGVGDNNAKQFLFRINRFRITKEEFVKALKVIEGRDD